MLLYKRHTVVNRFLKVALPFSTLENARYFAQKSGA
jgi:hypothetical protein